MCRGSFLLVAASGSPSRLRALPSVSLSPAALDTRPVLADDFQGLLRLGQGDGGLFDLLQVLRIELTHLL